MTSKTYIHNYDVEKILRRKKGMVLVKWIGYNKEHNSWIPESDIHLTNKYIDKMYGDRDIDDMDMKERGEKEAIDRRDREEETSFTDDRRRDDSYVIIDGSAPEQYERIDDGGETSKGPGGKVPNIGRDAGTMKRSMIHDMKQFLKVGLNITTNKGDGPSSTLLYDGLKVVRNTKTGEINGAKYRNKKIIFLKNGKMTLSTSKPNKLYVDEFKELLRKAKIEHSKTPAALAEEQVNVDISQDTIDSITDNVGDKLRGKIDSGVENIKKSVEITDNELRELSGLLDPKGETEADKLKAVEIERDNWRKKGKEKGDTRKGNLYESIAKVADLKADEIRLRLNQKPTTEEVINMVKEEAETNDLTRYERFKKWSRNNLVNLSAMAISIAGIITTVIMAGRNALKKGANALGNLGKAVANVVKNLAPVLSAVGTLIVKVLSFGAKGLLLLANNLWILVPALTYFTYNEYVSRRK